MNFISIAQRWVNDNFVFFCVLAIAALMLAGWIGHAV